jgi:hypothetical protein
MPEITDILEEQIEKEISSFTKLSESEVKKKYFSEKAYRLYKYEYKEVFMDNYGDPVYDKNKNLIGYKINGFEYASVETYYNDDNLLCNKISIKEFDETNLS